jgi:predicted small secreted protein
VIAILTIGAGCNTIQGLGKDIETGGKAIEKASGK